VDLALADDQVDAAQDGDAIGLGVKIPQFQ
jgi:hypothetical protein